MKNKDKTKQQLMRGLAEMCRQIYKLDMSETKCEQSKDEHARPIAKVIGAMGNKVIWVDMDEEITSAKETYYA